ncbi:MAG: hypothetical protein Fur0032_10800 [Terrimicrobiaceae bacterium]
MAGRLAAGDPIPGSFVQVDCDGGGWVTGLAAHSSGRIYARTDVGGVYATDDAGETWRFLSGDFTTPGAYCVQGVVVAPSDADTAYICLGTSNMITDDANGIWKTVDGGATWTLLKSNIRFSGNDEERYGGECITIHPDNENEIWAGTFLTGLLKSTDAGATWVQVGANTFGGVSIICVAIHAGFPDLVWVGTTSGLYVSTNRGATWTRVFAAGRVWRVVRRDADSVYVNGGAAYPTSFSGIQLQKITAGNWNNPATYALADLWPRWLDAFEAAFGWRPMEYNPGLTVLRDGTLLACGIYHGWGRSSDGGATWEMPAMKPVGPHPSWQYDPPPTRFQIAGNALIQDPANDARWYVTGGFGPARSDDAGATCRFITNGIGQTVTWRPVFDPSDPSKVYLPLADLGMAVVRDAGDSGGADGFIYPHVAWPDDQIVFCHRPLPSNGRLLAPGGEQPTGKARIYQSNDDGLTWTKAPAVGLPAESSRPVVEASACIDNPDDFLVVLGGNCTSSAGGVYRSADGGATFYRTSAGLPDFNAGGIFSWNVRIEREPGDATLAYLMIRFAGLYISYNRGHSWMPHPTQPPDTGGWVVSDPLNPSHLWFGSAYSGLWRSLNRGWTWQSVPGFQSVSDMDVRGGRVAVFGRRDSDGWKKIYYSGDAGASWGELTRPGHRFGNAIALAVDPHRPGRVWIGTNGRSSARFTPWTVLESWRNSYFGSPLPEGSAADASDPDSDALPNLLEYALGTDPHLASHPISAGMDAARLYLEFTPARVDSPRYFLEASDDLLAWPEKWDVTALLSPGEPVRLTDPGDPAGHPRRFLRLRVEAQ